MAAIVEQKLITAEEFSQMPDPPDGSKQELVRGVIVTMPPAKPKHGAYCSKIDRKLGGFVEDNKRGHVVCNDAGFIVERGPDSVRGPDISFWSFERLPVLTNVYPEIGPDLAVEVLSPGNRISQILDKIAEYFAAKVRMVWVVDTEDRTITVYRKPDEGKVLHEKATITGEDVLPGFSCKVADLLPS